MSGTKAGGMKSKLTNQKQFGEDFYKKIGSLGGRKAGVKKGFAANPALAKIAGAKGGRKSRRTAEPAKPKEYYYNGERELKNWKEAK